MTLFDILSRDERIIVLSDTSECTIYTWNKSLTLQAWCCVGKRWEDLDSWEELDVRTLSEEPDGFYAARLAAVRWQASRGEDT